MKLTKYLFSCLGVRDFGVLGEEGDRFYSGGRRSKWNAIAISHKKINSRENGD
ncbi:MAG: hypothetical protein AB4290_21325 [Spirulina sp.]